MHLPFVSVWQIDWVLEITFDSGCPASLLFRFLVHKRMKAKRDSGREDGVGAMRKSPALYD
jgi:hypothetical protein